MKNFSLGLDIGIASVGWALLDNDRNQMVDFGVRIFNEANSASDARLNRSARRTLNRKKWRKNQLKQVFIDFGLLTKEELDQPGYLSFTVNNEFVSRPKDETIYHLRNRALYEQVSLRELFLALYNICGTRGHFLMESIDFTKESITFDVFKEQFYSLLNSFVGLDFDLISFENDILMPIYEKKLTKVNDLKSLFKKGVAHSKEEDEKLLETCLLLIGRKADLKKIDESVALEDTASKVDVMDLLKKDDLNDFLDKVIELHDLIEVSNILKQYSYICEYNVSQLERVKVVYTLEKSDPKEYEEEKKRIQSVMSKTGPNKRRLRVIKNMQNKYPNGLYVKELVAILRKQQEFYPNITDELIEACSSICSARIPYYIGPLSSEAKNAWLKRDESIPFKYSYDYTLKHFGVVDEFETIKKWKKAMISRCTYLPDEYALPKGSFLGETFSILNEMNILSAKDLDGNDYYLSLDDKLKIMDQLFLKKTNVSYKDVSDLLGLSYFGPKSGVTKKFNNGYSLYLRLAAILPELRFDHIKDILIDKEKVNKIEDILLNVNLFDEDVSKKSYFMNECGYSEEIAKSLSKLKSKGFYSFSKKFIFETVINEYGQSLIEKLMDYNTSEYTNEQMTLIHNATDIDGNPLHFDSNKYLKKFNENHGQLDISLIFDGGKPFIPVSRPVIRSLNECFKVYSAIEEMYGTPTRVVVETARDFPDFNQVKLVPAKHFTQMSNCYKSLEEEVKKLSKAGKKVEFGLESWDDVSKYLVKNKRKIELYIRQNGKDMISGDSIDLDYLNDYEIDHILPRGFGDNSMNNLMLIHKNYNAKKSNRVPLEYIEQEHVTNQKGQLITSSNFIARCNELFKLQMISEEKLQQLTLKSTEDAMGFINRNLVDTRYIIREFMAVLRAYSQYHEHDTHIVALKAKFTDVYRDAFRIHKSRDSGDQHHAYDAATIVLADRVLSTYYPAYDSRGNSKAYKDFMNKMNLNEEDKKSSKTKLNNFIRVAYNKTFGTYPDSNDSIVTYIKNTTPLYSIKSERNFRGGFFDATLYKPTDSGVLTLLGVNNDKRSFSSINSVAVDFYKYTNKRNKKEHVAIHIPKVIVKPNGEIDKEKYITLIRDWYKKPELLDENGNIKEYYFCLRVYKNDLIYDTNQQTIQKFNIGSITNKKLEMKHVDCFAYNELEKRKIFYMKNLAEKFDFKMRKINDDGKKKFSDYDIHDIINYSIDNLMDIQDVNRYRKAIVSNLEKIENYMDYLDKLAFLDVIVNRRCTPPTIVGQYMPTISTPGEEARYIKIKSSVLGIRWKYNEKGKLLVSGPHLNGNAYSKIKKEKLTWNLSSIDVE